MFKKTLLSITLGLSSFAFQAQAFNFPSVDDQVIDTYIGFYENKGPIDRTTATDLMITFYTHSVIHGELDIYHADFMDHAILIMAKVLEGKNVPQAYALRQEMNTQLVEYLRHDFVFNFDSIKGDDLIGVIQAGLMQIDPVFYEEFKSMFESVVKQKAEEYSEHEVMTHVYAYLEGKTIAALLSQ